MSVLIEKLKEHGIINPSGTKKSLQEQCTRLNIPIKARVDVVVEGWHKKPKGAFQILYERGWIDPENIIYYTADGKKQLHQHVRGCTSQEESAAAVDDTSTPVDPTGCNFSIRSLMKLQ